MKNKKSVSIYTLSKFKDNCYILSNDLWFSNVMTEREFLRRHIDIIRQIDRAEIVNYEKLTIVTPFGETDISNLSTGCKALLNINYLLETGDKEKTYLVNVTDIGDNALNMVLEAVAGTNIDLFLRRSFIPKNMDLCYKINRTIVEGTTDLDREFNFVCLIEVD